jgi:hypothetical protein
MAHASIPFFLKLQAALIDNIDDCKTRLKREQDEPCLIYHDPALGRLYFRHIGKSITVSIGRDGNRERVTRLPSPISAAIGSELFEENMSSIGIAVTHIVYRRARARDTLDNTNTYSELVFDKFYAVV